MRIYINARFLTQPISGVQRYGIECSRQIKKLAPHACFIAPPDILHQDIAAELGVQIVGRRKGHRWEQIDLPLFIAKQKNAPLINLANTAPLFYHNNYVTIHDLAFYYHPEWNSRRFATWYNILIPRIAAKSKHVFTVSETIKAELMKAYHLPGRKITVTYNGISKAMLDQGMGEVPKEKIILSVGTFNKRKNHEQLVAGFIASGLGAQYRLVLVGDRNKAFSETKLNEQQLKDNNIDIVESPGEQELIALYRKAEVEASLSLYEGFGIPLLEGIYNGCKLVCSDIPAYREIYGGYAHFCPAADTGQIAAALRAAVAGLAPGLEERETLAQKYSYERSAEVILSKVTAGIRK